MYRLFLSRRWPTVHRTLGMYADTVLEDTISAIAYSIDSSERMSRLLMKVVDRAEKTLPYKSAKSILLFVLRGLLLRQSIHPPYVFFQHLLSVVDKLRWLSHDHSARDSTFSAGGS